MASADPPIGPDSMVVAEAQQVSVDLGEEILILHLSTAGYYSVRNVAARIWKLIENPVRVSEIGALLAREYGIPREQGVTDVLELLVDLQERELVRIST